MSVSEDHSRASPIDPSLVDTNAGEVPADRPHFASWPKRLARTVTLPETSLWHNVEVAAARYPSKAATLYFGRTKSYAALRAEAEAIAGWLQAQGVRRGDRVALFMQNCPQYLVAYHAILRADAVVVPVNAMNKAEEFGHYIVDPGTKVVICGAELAAIVASANAALPPSQRVARVLATRYADELPDAFADDLAPPPSMRDWLLADPPLPAGAARWQDALAEGHVPGPSVNGPDDLALLPYTSGTTGLPKGCMHTHRTLMANVIGGAEWGSASAESIVLGVVPMFHITGMLYGVISPMFGGATVVIMPRWDRELAGRLISRHKVSHWTCIPTMIIDLFASPHYRSFDLSSLRWLSGGGAAMPQAVAQRLLDEFGLRFCEGYGLTETAAPSHANPAERPKLQCLGIPFFGVDSRVVDPLTLNELPAGEVGEIVTRGPMLFRGYWKNPEATATAFVEVEGRRYFRTGDLGHMDADGYFFITDRLKRMINASGFKVWPSEVELLLYKHPGVQEACVISAQDAYRGETVKAIVVLRAEARGKLQERDIVAWAHEHMAAYKAPRIVEFVDVLPKSGAGKVMWRLLQDKENAAKSPLTPPRKDAVMGNTFVWVDIPVANLDRAIKFYSAVVGQPVDKIGGPGFNFGLFKHEGNQVGGCLIEPEEGVAPSMTGPLVYLDASGRLDAAIAAAEQGGGKVLKAKHSIAPNGFRAIIADSEGNRVALHSMTA